jgi:hypothetical protein
LTSPSFSSSFEYADAHVTPFASAKLYEHIAQGWLAINLLAAGLLSTLIVMTFYFTGNTPLRRRLALHLTRRPSGEDLNPSGELYTASAQGSRPPPTVEP